MTDEKLNPAIDKDPPLHLAETVQRAILYDRMAAALHDIRYIRIDEVSPEEMEAIKAVSEADTEELTLPAPRDDSGRRTAEKEITARQQASAKRREDYERNRSMERNVRDVTRRLNR